MNEHPTQLQKYMTASEVCQRYGKITTMTLHRWLKDPDTKFPRPIKIGKMRFFDIKELEAYDESMGVKARVSQ